MRDKEQLGERRQRKARRKNKIQQNNLGLPLHRQFQGTDASNLLSASTMTRWGQWKESEGEPRAGFTQVALTSSWVLVRTGAQLSPSLICSLLKPRNALQFFPPLTSYLCLISLSNAIKMQPQSIMVAAACTIGHNA